VSRYDTLRGEEIEIVKKPKLTWAYDEDGLFEIFIDGQKFDEWVLLDQEPEDAFVCFVRMFRAGMDYSEPEKLNQEVRRLRDALVVIAQLGSHYAQTPHSISIARKALGCKKMPFSDVPIRLP